MPEKIIGKAVIGQSGGPTAVINESLVGAVLESKKYPEIEGFWGARHGVKGILGEDFVDLHAESAENLAKVAKTPSAALGSVRLKPTADQCKEMFEVFKKHGIRYFFYIGGNDSAETAHIVNEVSNQHDYDLRVIHIPKTIDNDLKETDHCPGFGSAAKFVAQAFMGDNLDNRSLPGIKINIIMGRHAGFLTAASALARVHENDGPHLIYCPENSLSLEKFASDVWSVYEKIGRCVVAVSEGIHDESGTLFAERFSNEVDSHGNKQLSGTGALGDYLVKELKERLADKGTLRMRADTFGYLQRSFAGCRSETDAAEARKCGEYGVVQAVTGQEDGSIVITRSSRSDYDIHFNITDLSNVAQQTKLLTADDFNADKNDVSQQFVDYVKPIVGPLYQVGLLDMKKVS
jgi:6-phosphofructokinase 1